MAGSTEALNYLLTIGLSNIEARNTELTAQLKIELGKTDQVRLLDLGEQQWSIVTFSIAGAREEITQYYHNHGINI